MLQYLAIASDTMELYALFDEDAILVNFEITIAILAVWSVSFIQFIVVPEELREDAQEGNKKETRLGKLRVPLMAFFLQDCPFLCLRLYIMVRLKLVTYSLVFFVIKNVLAVIIEVYQIFTSLCCSEENKVHVSNESAHNNSLTRGNNELRNDPTLNFDGLPKSQQPENHTTSDESSTVE